LSRKAVLAEIGGLEGVADIELKKAPIEQVIAELYTSWKSQQGNPPAETNNFEETVVAGAS
jgi:DNA gyrase inhibitor GyrI